MVCECVVVVCLGWLTLCAGLLADTRWHRRLQPSDGHLSDQSVAAKQRRAVALMEGAGQRHSASHEGRREDEVARSVGAAGGGGEGGAARGAAVGEGGVVVAALTSPRQGPCQRQLQRRARAAMVHCLACQRQIGGGVRLMHWLGWRHSEWSRR